MLLSEEGGATLFGGAAFSAFAHAAVEWAGGESACALGLQHEKHAVFGACVGLRPHAAEQSAHLHWKFVLSTAGAGAATEALATTGAVP